MHIPVHSPWLLSYGSVVQTVLVMLTVAGIFPDRPHIYNLFTNPLLMTLSLVLLTPRGPVHWVLMWCVCVGLHVTPDTDDDKRLFRASYFFQSLIIFLSNYFFGYPLRSLSVISVLLSIPAPASQGIMIISCPCILSVSIVPETHLLQGYAFSCILLVI